MDPKEAYDNPLTAAEWEITWYPLPSVRDLTLSDQELYKGCPLTQHRRCKKPRYGLGRLDALPLEIFSMILVRLDINSLMSLQRINRRGFDTVHEMPQLRAIIQHCPDVLRGILSTETARFINCRQLLNKLSSPSCESCNDFAGYLYLLTCTRVCFRCFTRLPSYLPISKSQALRQFGLSTTDVGRLTFLKSVPGHYTIKRINFRNRLVLLDSDTARQASTCIDERASVMDTHITSHVEQRLTVSNERTVESTGNAKLRRARTLRNSVLRDDLEYNPRRFMAIIEIPYLELQSGGEHWGVYCYACRNEFGDLKHSRRQFLAAGFRQHLRQCGEVIDHKHVRRVSKIPCCRR